MNRQIWYVSAIIIILSFILSYTGYWYLIFIPGLFAGVALNRKYDAVVPAVFAIVGTVLSMIGDVSYRFGQASLFDSIAGLPSGYALPLLLLFLITFILSLLGLIAGSSFNPLVFEKNAKSG